MADNIFEMTHSLGQTRYTRFDETHDNEKLVDQISETAAIGDAEGSGTEGSEVCVKLLSVAEVAERLQVSQSLVYKMIERRQIPSMMWLMWLYLFGQPDESLRALRGREAPCGIRSTPGSSPRSSGGG